MATKTNGQNASRVEFGQVSKDVLGSFSQINPGNWAELGAAGEVRFRFAESGRDEWSVYLFDASRQVSIQLDLWTKKVMYSAPGTERVELYQVLHSFSLPPTFVFSSLKKFNDWHASGGEQRAGLPAGSMNPLSNKVLQVRTSLRQIVHDLEGMKTKWQRVQKARQPAGTNVVLTQYVADLLSLRSQMNQTLTSSTQSRGLAQGAGTLISLHMAEDNRNITSANKNLTSARTRQNQARTDLRNAKAELRGNKGALNGFLTGLTLTIHNPVQENIDKANAAIASINTEVANINNQLNTLRQASSELAEGNHTLQYIGALNGALADYQNILSAAESALQEGKKDAAKAAAATKDRVGAFYKKQAGKEMAELFSWIEPFKAAR